MFKKITLKFMIIIILLFAFVNIYSLNPNKVDINTINIIETIDLSGIETKEINLLPYVKNRNAPYMSHPIFKTDLDIGS